MFSLLETAQYLQTLESVSAESSQWSAQFPAESSSGVLTQRVEGNFTETRPGAELSNALGAAINLRNDLVIQFARLRHPGIT